MIITILGQREVAYKYNKNINPRGQKVAVKELIKDSSVATQNFLGEAKVMT